MNEKRIREVIEVEKRALDLLARANRDAEQLPVEAEAQATAIVEAARSAAQDEATRIIEEARKGAESTAIMSEAEEKMNRLSSLAEKNREKAIGYVLERVLGKA